MKKLSFLLILTLIVSMFAGCAGTPVVYYTDCTCPTGSHEPAVQATVPAAPAEGALKTGLYISTSVGKSQSAAEDTAGKADYDVTMVAVLVDDEGIIRDCIIDGIASSVSFDGTGTIVSEIGGTVATKNELGANYGMVAIGHAIAEWDEQAAALASYAIGRTVEELKSGAIDETGKAPAGSDLASSATIYLGGYVAAIEAAAANAQHLGAQAGDTLKLASVNKLSGSTSVTEEKDGTAQLDATVTALTMNGQTITSCVIDSVQAKVSFDAAGTITSDTSAPVATKNELGAAYGMVAIAHAIAEWNEQAASFAAYITGKTPAEVAGIAVDATTKPTEADLTSSVTIAIGDFLTLVEKAAQ